MGKKYIQSIMNATPFAFRLLPEEFPELVTYCHPGRTWVTGGRYGHGIAVPDLSHSGKHGLDFAPNGNISDHGRFWLAKKGDNLMVYRDGDITHATKVCSGIEKTQESLSIIIKGTSLGPLSFEIQHDKLPMPFIKNVFIQGFKNSTPWILKMSNVKEGKFDPHAASVEIQPYQYQDIGGAGGWELLHGTNNANESGKMRTGLFVDAVDPSTKKPLRSFTFYQRDIDIVCSNDATPNGQIVDGSGKQATQRTKFLEIFGGRSLFDEPRFHDSNLASAFGFRAVDSVDDLIPPVPPNTVELAAIDNRTSYFTFVVSNVDASERLVCYPGRTWATTRPYRPTDDHSGGTGHSFSGGPSAKFKPVCWSLPTFPNALRVLATPVADPKSKSTSEGELKQLEFGLALQGDNLLFVPTGGLQPHVIAKKVTELNDRRIQLSIEGTMLEQLRFAVSHNMLPAFRPACGLAGVMNNSDFAVKVRTHRSGHPVKEYSIDAYKYADFGSLTLSQADFGSKPPLTHGGLVIPQSDATHPSIVTEYIEVVMERPNGAQTWRIYQHNVNIFAGSPSQPPNVPATLIEGGASQADSELKYLDIVGLMDAGGIPTLPDSTGARLRLSARPHHLRPFIANGHIYPLSRVNMRATWSTELMKDIRPDPHNANKTRTSDSYTTKVKIYLPREKKSLVGASLRVSMMPPTDVRINGGDMIPASRFENGGFVIAKTNSKGEILIVQPVINNFGSPIYRITVNHDLVHGAPVLVEVHPHEKVMAKFMQFKTIADFRWAQSKDGNPIFPVGARITASMVNAFTETMILASTPSSVNPVSVPGEELMKGESKKYVGNAEKCLVNLCRGMNFKNGTCYCEEDCHHMCHGAKPAPKEKSLWERICEWAREKWDTVTNWVLTVADGVVSFVIDGVNWIVNTVTEIFGALGAIFTRGLDGLYDALADVVGSMFDWKAIGVSYTWIHDMIDSGLTKVPAMVNALSANGHRFVDNLKQMANNPTLKNSDLMKKNSDRLQEEGEDGDPKMRQQSEVTSSPAFSWANDTFTEFSAGHITPYSQQMALDEDKRLDQLGRRDYSSVTSKTDSWKDKSLSDILNEFVQAIAIFFAEGALNLFDTFAYLLDTAFSTFRSLSSIPMPIPVLTQLWRKYCRSANNHNEAPTLLEVLCMVIAFPTAYMMKFVNFVTGKKETSFTNAFATSNIFLSEAEVTGVFNYMFNSSSSTAGPAHLMMAARASASSATSSAVDDSAAALAECEKVQHDANIVLVVVSGLRIFTIGASDAPLDGLEDFAKPLDFVLSLVNFLASLTSAAACVRSTFFLRTDDVPKSDKIKAGGVLFCALAQAGYLAPPILSWHRGNEPWNLKSQAGTEISATILDMVGNGIAIAMICTNPPSTGLSSSDVQTLTSLCFNIIYGIFNISVAGIRLSQPYVDDGKITLLVIARGLVHSVSLAFSTANILSDKTASIISPF